MVDRNGIPVALDDEVVVIGRVREIADDRVLVVLGGGRHAMRCMEDEVAVADTTRNSDQRAQWWADFLTPSASANGWSEFVSGAGAALVEGAGFVSTTTRMLGVLELQTGTEDVGAAAIYTGNVSMLVSNGAALTFESRLLLDTQSSSAQEFRAELGFGNDWDSTSWPSDSIVFRSDRASYGDQNWRAVTRRNGTETVTDTAIEANQNTGGDPAREFKIEVDEDGAEVRFYIDGSLVATHTTNIPTTSDPMGIGVCIQKSNGTTSRSIGVDWTRFTVTFSDPR